MLKQCGLRELKLRLRHVEEARSRLEQRVVEGTHIIDADAKTKRDYNNAVARLRASLTMFERISGYEPNIALEDEHLCTLQDQEEGFAS